MEKIKIGSWVKYKVEDVKYSNDPFFVPSSTGGQKEVYAVVIQVDRNNCVITWYEDVDGVPTFKTMLTSINSVEVISPYISNSNKETTEEIVCEHNHNYVDISAYANPDIDYSDSLFDPNEKDPVMRALNMVKEYCNVSIREINQGRAISTDCFKVDAYEDVINFIEEHQKKCQDVKSYSSLDLDKLIEETDNSYIKHLENEIEWFKGRMDDYKKSFFMVCDLIKSSNVPESIKYFVKQEELKY